MTMAKTPEAAAAAGLPPRPPAEPPAAASAPPPAPPRRVRPAAPNQLQLVEYAVHRFSLTLKHDQVFEDLLEPGFWANVSDRLIPCDTIDVHAHDRSFYAELYVREVARAQVRAGAKGGALVHVLRYVEFDPAGARPKVEPEHEVRFLGPAQGWCVIRISDQRIVAENLPDRGAAEKQLAGLMAAAAESAKERSIAERHAARLNPPPAA
jgi:hypothetical protein